MDKCKDFSQKTAIFLYDLNAFLGFLPRRTANFNSSERAKIHPYIAAAFITLLFSYSLIQGPDVDQHSSQLATHVALTHLSFVLMYVSLLVTYYRVRVHHGDAILSLMKSMHAFDYKLQKNFTPGKRFTLEVVSFLLLMLFYFLYEEIDRGAFNMYAISRKLFLSLSLILGLQIYSFGMQFFKRFKELNKLLMTFGRLKDHQHQQEDVYGLFLTLINLVHDFNKIFGWQIVFLCGTFVLCILHVINLLIVVLSFNGWNEIDIEFCIVFIAYLLTTLILCIPFASSCNGAAEEAKFTSLLAYSLLTRKPVDNDVNRELTMLAGVPWPGFSAAGFFTVDHTMLFTLFGSVTSYLIVLIQLKDMRI